MRTASFAETSLCDIRDMDVFAEARKFEAFPDESSADVDPSARAICHTILFATDVLRRTILAVHDAEQVSQEYNP